MGRYEVNVMWKPPAKGGTPDYYRIDRSEGGDVWMRLVQMHTGADLSISDTDGVKPDKTYRYRVFAVNLAGTGPASDNTAKSVASTGKSGPPGPVLNFNAEEAGPESDRPELGSARGQRRSHRNAILHRHEGWNRNNPH